MEEPERETTGTLALPLETRAASGTRYRLRQAVFLVDRSNSSGIFGGFGGLGSIGGSDFGGLFGGASTVGGVAGGGSTVGGIAGGDFPDAGSDDAVDDPASTGGTVGGEVDASSGGFFAGGTTGGFFGAIDGGGMTGGPIPGGSDAGVIVEPGPVLPPDLLDLFGFRRELSIDSEDNPLAPEIRKEIPAGTYRIFLQNGWFLERVEGNTSVEVDARLVDSPTQIFTISSGSDTQLFYTFETEGQIISFEKRGGLVIKPTVIETQPDGSVGEGGVTPDFGSVIELNRDALSTFTLSEVLDAVARNAGLPSDPTLLYQTMIDSYASKGNSRQPLAHHCGDEVTDGGPSLNGFPLRCDRIETLQFDNLNRWFATAVVSRIDLAPEDGSHCGQQRMVFANNANGRIFMILEAQIPNPHPECGVDACRPLAQAWLDLSVSDPGTRGNLLREMFLTGSASLTEQGFAPFMSANNMTVGSGTIRTNNFDDFPWTLREFKVVVNEGGGEVIAVPFPVAESPAGDLWNDQSSHPAAEACRADFLQALDGLLTDNVSRMRFVVADECKNAESQNDGFSENYALHLGSGSGAFAQQIQARIEGTGLTPTDIANRARFGGSCIGCHMESGGAFLGNGVFAPPVRDFPQILEFTETCADGTNNCSGISPGLLNEFLPHRQQVHRTLLDRPGCGMVPPVDAGAPEPPDAGVGQAADAGGPQDASVAPPTVPELPVAAPVDDLVAAEQRARSMLKGLTIGGQPARTTH